MSLTGNVDAAAVTTRYDVFVVLDNSTSAASHATFIRETFGSSLSGMEFTSSVPTTAFCAEPSAISQASKLQACWGQIVAHEGRGASAYSHVVRLRPDLLIPRATASVAAAHLWARPSVSSMRVSDVMRPTHNWGDAVCVVGRQPDTNGGRGGRAIAFVNPSAIMRLQTRRRSPSVAPWTYSPCPPFTLTSRMKPSSMMSFGWCGEGTLLLCSTISRCSRRGGACSSKRSWRSSSNPLAATMHQHPEEPIASDYSIDVQRHASTERGTSMYRSALPLPSNATLRDGRTRVHDLDGNLGDVVAG